MELWAQSREIETEGDQEDLASELRRSRLAANKPVEGSVHH